MEICFNALKSGLGNNGGTKTIVRSAETLQSLGHEVSIAARVNHYTYTSVEVPVLGEIPRHSIVVGVSSLDVDEGIHNDFWWIRGWELWNYKEPRLLEKCRTTKCIAISTWLVEHLNKNGIDCELCYAGMDLDKWGVDKPWTERKFWGALYSSRHKTKRWDLVQRLDWFIDKPLLALGIDCRNADYAELRKFYNKCRVWVATSELEGFHQVPAEAALCGCSIVRPSTDRCGMNDYSGGCASATMVYGDGLEDAVDALDYAWGRNEIAMRECIIDRIGDRAENMDKFVHLLNNTVIRL